MASPSGEVSSAPSGAPLDNARPRLAKRYRTPLLLVLSTLVLATVAIYVWRLRTPPALTFVTQPVIRQTLVQSASATGTVNAQDTISVGSQVSGTISELLVDYDSRVRKGDILARIDPSTFRAQFDQASSAYAQAGEQSECDLGCRTKRRRRGATHEFRLLSGAQGRPAQPDRGTSRGVSA